MMSFYTFPSFRDNGTLVQLNDFLRMIPENDYIWKIIFFEGIGTAPENLRMEEFEALVEAKPDGYSMTWSEIQIFACSLEQTIDCLIVAGKTDPKIIGDKLMKESFIDSEIIIEAFDSTEWAVWAKDQNLMRKLKSTYYQAGSQPIGLQSYRGPAVPF